MSLVAYAEEGPIAVLRLDRPEKLNAVNAAMVADLGAALDRAEASEAVRAVLLHGEGRAFSAGHDLLEFGERGSHWRPWSPDRFDVGLGDT